MEIFHGPGFCPSCKNALITVNDVKKCIFCDVSKPVSGNASTTEDPGEDKLNEMLGNSNSKAVSVAKVVKVCSIEDAIEIMKRQPMPDDVKKFKKIKKIIDLMEQLLVEA